MIQSEELKRRAVDFPGGTVGKDLLANPGDTGSIHCLGRSHMPWSKSARKPQTLNPCAATTEARTPRAGVLQQDKPLQEAHTPQ